MAKQPRTGRAPSINSIGARITEEQGLRLAAAADLDHPWRKKRNLNADDLAVDRLAHAMKAKLAKKRKQGFGGWDSPLECSIERLAQMLGEVVCKGDPVDVANLAMMLHARGADHQAIAQRAMRALLFGSREDQSQRIAELEQQLAEARKDAAR